MKDIEKLEKAFQIINKHSGPGWYGWCSVVDGSINDFRGAWFECEPALKAAIIAYACEVIDTYDVYHWTCTLRAYADSYCVYIKPKNQPVFDRSYITRLDASIALIIAVAEALENEAQGDNDE